MCDASYYYVPYYKESELAEMNYYDNHIEYAWVPKNDVKKVVDEIVKTKEELAKAKAETALLRKAYEELADSKSKVEAQKENLVNELADRDAVLSFLWDKMFPAK